MRIQLSLNLGQTCTFFFSSINNSQLIYSLSKDNGQNWSPTTLANNGNEAFLAVNGPVVHAMWTDRSSANGQLFYLQNPNGNPQSGPVFWNLKSKKLQNNLVTVHVRRGNLTLSSTKVPVSLNAPAFSFAPSSTLTSILRTQPGGLSVHIQIPKPFHVPIYLYIYKWETGIYQFLEPERKTLTIKSANLVPAPVKGLKLIVGKGRQFSGIVAFPGGTNEIVWHSGSAHRIEFTLAVIQS